MANSSTVRISLVVDTAGKGFKELANDANGFRAAMTGAIQEADKMNRAINFIALQQGFQSLSSVATQLEGVCRNLSAAYTEQVRVEQQLATVMRNTMNATENDIQAIKDLCSAQQQLGVVGDEVQLAGAQKLATFLSERDALEVLIPLMNDMIVSQYGVSATGESAANMAMLLGKAMTGQETALRRYGYSFTEAQSAILKTGTEMERAAVLTEVIGRRIGGSNAEMARSTIGSFVQMQNAIGDFKEQMGGLVQGAMPVISSLAGVTTIVANGGRLFTGIKATTLAMKSFTVSIAANTKALVANAIAQSRVLTLLKTGAVRMAAGRSSAIFFRGAIASMGTSVAAAAGSVASFIGSISFMAGPIAIAVAAIGALYYQIDRVNKKMEHSAALTRAWRAELARGAEANSERVTARRNAQANIERDIRSLNRAGDKPEAERQRLIARMNETYGAEMGYFNTVADWADALTQNKIKYVTDTWRRTRLSQIETERAELQERNHNLIYNEDGTRRRYSTERRRDADKRLLPSDYERFLNENHGILNDIERLDRERRQLETALSSPYARTGSSIQGMPVETPAVEAPVSTTAAPAPDIAPAARTLNEGAITLAELLENAAYYRDQKNNATTPEEYAAAHRGEDFWTREADMIRGTTAAVPSAFNEAATTLSEIESNISILRESLGGATAESAVQINQQIAHWQDLADAIRSAGTEMVLDPTANTLSSIGNNIALLNEQLQDATIDEAAAINSSIELWNKKAQAIRDAGVAGTETMKENTASVTDYTSTLSSGLNSIAGITEGATQAWLKYSSELLGSLGQMIAGILALANVNGMNSAMKMPFPLNLVALASTTAALAAAAINIPKFADGGIVSGPTLALVGEYPGASNNPEVIAPLDKLQAAIGGGAGMGGVVEFRIKDRELYGILHKYEQLRSHT